MDYIPPVSYYEYVSDAFSDYSHGGGGSRPPQDGEEEETILYFLWDLGHMLSDSLKGFFDILFWEVDGIPLIYYLIGTGFSLYATYAVIKWIIPF